MNARYFGILISIIVVAVCFWVGLKAGLFLFPKKTQTTASAVPAATTIIPTSTPAIAEKNYCAPDIKFSDESDKKFCSRQSKAGGEKSLEIDLTSAKALLYEKGEIKDILPLAYQSQEGKWFQAPTGYYFTGVKHEKHLSSIFPVTMPYALQYYEDFFIHGIPYYKNGDPVTSSFTGGCLRFANGIDKQVYNFINPGDPVLVYKTFDDLNLKSEFSAPVDLKDFWIRQRFNNPYRNSWIFGGTEYLKFDYYQHAGVDFAPNPDSKNKSVYSIYDGVIAEVQKIGENDHGFGNTIIIEHKISSAHSTDSGQASSKQTIYSLYAHLSSVSFNIQKGAIIKKGEKIGEIGNSGYGCENYWKIGKDGCPSTDSGQIMGKDDVHLHFELKKSPVLTNPEGGNACQSRDLYYIPCFGYTPDYPDRFGYFDPTTFLFEKK